MRNLILSIACLGLFMGTTWSQELPRVSQKATVKQRIGLTDISIEYSRPNANKRELFGTVVPYGEVWRLGANECTKFTTSSDIVFSKGVLKKGTYAMFATVNKAGFILHFNSDFAQWGSNKYDKEKNVLSVNLKMEASGEYYESFSISFKDLKVNKGTMTLKWGKGMVDVAMNVPTMKLAKENIKAAEKKGEKLEEVYSNAAEFYLDFAKNYKKAKSYANKSLKVKESIGGFYVMAAVLKANKEDKEAKKYLKNAINKAKSDGSEGWENYLNKKLAAWEKE